MEGCWERPPPPRGVKVGVEWLLLLLWVWACVFGEGAALDGLEAVMSMSMSMSGECACSEE